MEIKRPKISNVSFKFGEIKNGSIEKLSFVDGEIVANVDTKFHLIQITIDGERISSPILKTENGWVVRVHEVDASEEDISFLYPTLTDDSEFSLLFVSSGDDIDAEGGEGGGLCGCEPFELTAEAVQSVVPMAWGSNVKTATATGYAFAFGDSAKAEDRSVVAGWQATSKRRGLALGNQTVCESNGAAVGCQVKASAPLSISFGAQFTETIDDTKVTRTCTTQGTGSITIGAGANTLNSTTADGSVTESSNAVTIGCKALNQGADSVVIGAGASNTFYGSTILGAGALVTNEYATAIGRGATAGRYGTAMGQGVSASGGTSVAFGCKAKSSGANSAALGYAAQATSGNSLAVGFTAEAKAKQSVSIGSGAKTSEASAIAIGCNAQAADEGAVVFRSTDSDGTSTQLYFSGQNTPLALKYYPTEWEKKQDVDDQGNPKVDENGEPVMVDDKDKPTKGQAMMGYVVSKVITNEEGKQETKVLECGTNLLAALFPNHGLGDNPFQPTTTAIDGEEIMSFHPSDLDMPIEEDTFEPEEYQPLPVYPIVEPEIEKYIQE